MYMTTFSLILFIGIISSINTLNCYSCLSRGEHTTDCHDPLNINGTGITIVSVTTTDAICTKIVGKLNNNERFSLRKGSLTGCPNGLNSSEIVGNLTDLQVTNLKIYCCNKHFCNHGVKRERFHYFLLFFLFIIMYVI
ncbi:hypothetical protein I4U23_005908 [Adineta vaga]|nr:hypothetical protein I4U23_005908 [Adineta vaga]